MMKKIVLNDTFNVELPADVTTDNFVREVNNACYSFVTPRLPTQPLLIHASIQTANLIGLTEGDLKTDTFLKLVSGAQIIQNSKPYAMCYAGHQFGNWAGQLGDGRAINLGEINYNKKKWALQLKGAGPTPYSRNADGLAVLRSSIREHLCSEAMFYLGVPTTRSLSLSLTGDNVLRDVLYNGNLAYEKGAVVCRVAQSFIRFGNFELLASKGDIKNLQLLANYTITHFYPTLKINSKQGYINLFKEITEQTKTMIIHWQRVGFVHGVMNTDNMSILGLTIDYGPYGWLEDYNPNWTPNTTDSKHNRYCFGNQLHISLWNLAKLANALYPLINDTEQLQAILTNYKTEAETDYLNMMRTKLGLDLKLENDVLLITELEKNLQLSEIDYTLFFRKLSNLKKETTDTTAEFITNLISSSSYLLNNNLTAVYAQWKKWFDNYVARLTAETRNDGERKQQMNLINPKYVLRNYMAQLAIEDGEKENYNLINELHLLLTSPYNEQPEFEKWFAKRPDWAKNKIGSSMLSCSS